MDNRMNRGCCHVKSVAVRVLNSTPLDNGVVSSDFNAFASHIIKVAVFYSTAVASQHHSPCSPPIKPWLVRHVAVNDKVDHTGISAEGKYDSGGVPYRWRPSKPTPSRSLPSGR